MTFRLSRFCTIMVAIYVTLMLFNHHEVFAQDSCISPDERVLENLDAKPTWVLPVSGSVDLCENERYFVTMIIEGPSTILDCHNATIEGRFIRDHGLMFRDYNNFSNITIRNCRFREFLVRGINLFSRATGDYYPTNNKLVNVVVEDSGEVGIFVGPLATDTLVMNSEIRRSRSAGVYLERESRGTEVTGSIIEDNGYPPGDSEDYRREGIAIDASHNNYIHDNLFRNNGLAEITLYKNCGERSLHGAPGIKRVSGADNNLIARNTFESSNGGVGIIVASRQGRAALTCSADWYYETICDDKPCKLYPDFARNNTILYNEFHGFTNGVNVHDDDTKIIANDFANHANPRAVPIYVGSHFKDKVLRKRDLSPVEVQYFTSVPDPDDEPLIEIADPPRPIVGYAVKRTVIYGNTYTTDRLYVRDHNAEIWMNP